MRLFVGDDWAEDHHDVEVMSEAGRVLAKRRLPEGVAGMARLHALVGEQLGEGADVAEVAVGIETDHGPWVAALVAAGYTVFAVNPLQASRYRERHGVSGAKSDAGDAHMLADMVRTDSHQFRAVAGDSAEAAGVRVLARTHKTLIWERTRQVQRLRHQLLELLRRRAGGLRRPGRARRPRAAGQGAGPGPGRRADPRAGQRRAQARPPPGHRRQDGRDPGGAAQPAAGPAAGRHRRLRRHRPVPDRGDHRPERAGVSYANDIAQWCRWRNRQVLSGQWRRRQVGGGSRRAPFRGPHGQRAQSNASGSPRERSLGRLR